MKTDTNNPTDSELYEMIEDEDYEYLEEPKGDYHKKFGYSDEVQQLVCQVCLMETNNAISMNKCSHCFIRTYTGAE